MPKRSPKPARRLPKQRRSEETAGVILDAAAQVLVREGYARATTNRIALRAGVSVGSIYQYFDDKNAIFDALIDRFFGIVVDAVRSDPVDASLPLQEVTRRLVTVGLRAWPLGLEILRLLEQVPDAGVRGRSGRAKAELHALLHTIVEAHRDELRVEDLDEALWLVLNAAEGMLYGIAPGDDVDRTAGEIATMLSRYLLRDEAMARR